MKKIQSLFTEIASKENLYRAAKNAARGKRSSPSAALFWLNLEENIHRLYQELSEKRYRHGAYRVFEIFEPKKRTISAAPFRDRVVHHAVHDVIEPRFDQTFIYHSFACRRGKGTHEALRRAESFMRATRFYFYGDIQKFFPSIDHALLKALLRKRIADSDLLWLLEEIIDSANSLSPRTGCGLPIGNLTSQFFANLYLNELDTFVKFELREKRYVRYMDDFFIFGDDRAHVDGIGSHLRAFLSDHLRLTLHPGKSYVGTTAGGVRFVGFHVKKTGRRLLTESVRRFWRRLRRLNRDFSDKKVDAAAVTRSVQSWTAHTCSANARRLRQRLVERAAQQGWAIAPLLAAPFGLAGKIRPAPRRDAKDASVPRHRLVLSDRREVSA